MVTSCKSSSSGARVTKQSRKMTMSPATVTSSRLMIPNRSDLRHPHLTEDPFSDPSCSRKPQNATDMPKVVVKS
jgi:hypothetical protein